MGWRKETGTTGTKKTWPPDIVFIHPDVPKKELFCHDSPVRVVLSNSARTRCHFLGSTSEEQKNLLSTASDRDGASTKKSLHKVEKIYDSEKWVVNVSSQP